MNALRRVGAIVLMLLGVAAMLFALRECSATPDSAEPEPSASASEELESVKMSTTKIEETIKARLDQVAGRAVRVVCPKKVEQKVGTTFDCEVFYGDDDTVAATAAVEIDGPDGHFAWESTPTESAEDADALDEDEDS